MTRYRSEAFDQHLIAIGKKSAHFPPLAQENQQPGHVACTCGVKVSALPVIKWGEDPWKPLMDKWVAHRKEMGANRTEYSRTNRSDGTGQAFIKRRTVA